MLTIIDRANGHVIQKVTKPNGNLIRFQFMPENGMGDTEQVKVASTLTEARNAIGHHIVAKVELTKPKAEYPQNQPGYKAPPGTGKTEQLGKTRHKK